MFPNHCPGHCWCVVVDKSSLFYGELDSLCQSRSSPYVFELLSSLFQTAGDMVCLRKRVLGRNKMQDAWEPTMFITEEVPNVDHTQSGEQMEQHI
jgi:hypothetical protein